MHVGENNPKPGLRMTKEADELSGLKGSKEELNQLVAKSASTISPEQVLQSKFSTILQSADQSFQNKERATELGLSQFGVGEGSQFISKKKTAPEENMGTLYTKLSGQKLSYPALVFDRCIIVFIC